MCWKEVWAVHAHPATATLPDGFTRTNHLCAEVCIGKKKQGTSVNHFTGHDNIRAAWHSDFGCVRLSAEEAVHKVKGPWVVLGFKGRHLGIQRLRQAEVSEHNAGWATVLIQALVEHVVCFQVTMDVASTMQTCHPVRDLLEDRVSTPPAQIGVRFVPPRNISGHFRSDVPQGILLLSQACGNARGRLGQGHDVGAVLPHSRLNNFHLLRTVLLAIGIEAKLEGVVTEISFGTDLGSKTRVGSS